MVINFPPPRSLLRLVSVLVPISPLFGTPALVATDCVEHSYADVFVVVSLVVFGKTENLTTVERVVFVDANGHSVGRSNLWFLWDDKRMVLPWLVVEGVKSVGMVVGFAHGGATGEGTCEYHTMYVLVSV